VRWRTPYWSTQRKRVRPKSAENSVVRGVYRVVWHTVKKKYRIIATAIGMEAAGAIGDGGALDIGAPRSSGAPRRCRGIGGIALARSSTDQPLDMTDNTCARGCGRRLRGRHSVAIDGARALVGQRPPETFTRAEWWADALAGHGGRRYASSPGSAVHAREKRGTNQRTIPPDSIGKGKRSGNRSMPRLRASRFQRRAAVT